MKTIWNEYVNASGDVRIAVKATELTIDLSERLENAGMILTRKLLESEGEFHTIQDSGIVIE